jgi:hypothetical protein
MQMMRMIIINVLYLLNFHRFENCPQSFRRLAQIRRHYSCRYLAQKIRCHCFLWKKVCG